MKRSIPSLKDQGDMFAEHYWGDRLPKTRLNQDRCDCIQIENDDEGRGSKSITAHR